MKWMSGANSSNKFCICNSFVDHYGVHIKCYKWHLLNQFDDFLCSLDALLVQLFYDQFRNLHILFGKLWFIWKRLINNSLCGRPPNHFISSFLCCKRKAFNDIILCQAYKRLTFSKQNEETIFFLSNWPMRHTNNVINSWKLWEKFKKNIIKHFKFKKSIKKYFKQEEKS